MPATGGPYALSLFWYMCVNVLSRREELLVPISRFVTNDSNSGCFPHPVAGIYLVAKSIEADRQKELLDAQNNNEENQRILILPGQHAEKQRAAAAAKDDVDGPPSLQRVCVSYHYARVLSSRTCI